MRDKKDKFSVHYDRIVDYNIPKVAKRPSQQVSTPAKAGKAMSSTFLILISIITLALSLGTIWFFTQKMSDSETKTPEKIIMENIANGQVMGRP